MESKNKTFPQAKKDLKGNLITKPEPLKKLYLNTYIDRLKHRDMKTEFKEIFDLKTTLWNERLKDIKVMKTPQWKMTDILKATKSLKKNQCRDPNGLIHELFHQDVMGQDLKRALLFLMNGVKENLQLPNEMKFANISTIFKNKGSRLEMDNDRGIFIVSVLRKILDKLIYEDKYEFIESEMPDSNIGAQRGKIFEIICLLSMG